MADVISNSEPALDYAARPNDQQFTRAMTRSRLLLCWGIEIIGMLAVISFVWFSVVAQLGIGILPLTGYSLVGPLVGLVGKSSPSPNLFWYADIRYMLLAIPLLITMGLGLVCFKQRAARVASYVAISVWVLAGFVPIFAEVCNSLGQI